MTVNEIMRLLDAGYTKEEIAALTSEPKPAPEVKPDPKPAPEVKPDPKPAPEVKPEPKPAPEVKPEPKPAPEVKPEPAEDQTGARLDALEKSIASLIKTIQVSNVNNKNIPTLPTDSTKIVDDAMASIIRPTIIKKEG